MNNDNHIILAVHITNRVSQVETVQKTLTEFGCLIKTRLGLHETSQDFCSPAGLMILELLNNSEEMLRFKETLNAIDGVEAKEIIFSH